MNLLVQVLSQYQLLELLANYVSTKDLYHLGRTCSELFSCIVKPANTFTRLKRVSLCDGSGLKARQNYDSPLYNGLQSLGIMNWRLMPGQRRRSCHCQEEVEVRVWGKNCDEVNALPCVKCGINVCEECRYVPRIRSTSGYDVPRRPHFNRTQEISNIVCYCDECEPAAEKLADDKFCECDVYTRWICHQCRVKEREEVIAYERNFAKFHSNPLAEDEFMVLDDHQGHRAVRALFDRNIWSHSAYVLPTVLVSLWPAGSTDGEGQMHLVQEEASYKYHY